MAGDLQIVIMISIGLFGIGMIAWLIIPGIVYHSDKRCPSCKSWNTTLDVDRFWPGKPKYSTRKQRCLECGHAWEKPGFEYF